MNDEHIRPVRFKSPPKDIRRRWLVNLGIFVVCVLIPGGLFAWYFQYEPDFSSHPSRCNQGTPIKAPIECEIDLSQQTVIEETLRIRSKYAFSFSLLFHFEDQADRKRIVAAAVGGYAGIGPDLKGVSSDIRVAIRHVQTNATIVDQVYKTSGYSGNGAHELIRAMGHVSLVPGDYRIRIEVLRGEPAFRDIRSSFRLIPMVL